MADSDQRALHTIIVSDLHLTELEEQDPSRPMWMRYKHRDLCIDDCLARFLEHQRAELPGPAELVLNGDIFDFDAVMAIPSPPPFRVSWLERLRGLAPEEAKSRFKMEVILRDHAVFVAALRDWILAGNRVVVVVGNHDMELHWPGVQQELLDSLDLPEASRELLRVCEWFYVSNGDTLVEHGSQHDSYCVCQDPIHPFIKLGHRLLVRTPFGNNAGRLMLNGMGLFNPYAESSFIKPLHEYVLFFFREVVRIQPTLGWSWLWSAIATLVVSLRDGFTPAMRSPLTLDERETAAAERANTSPGTLRALRELRAHPAIFNPWKILRELWLDRTLLFAVLAFISFQVVGFLNIFGDVSPGWALLLFLLLLPPFLFYARSVNSDVDNTNRALKRRMPMALRITGTQRAVVGHTHEEGHLWRGETEMINTGTWSPAFADVHYTRPIGRKCFAWIHPDGDGERVAELYEWRDPGCERIEPKRLPPPVAERLQAFANRFPGVRGVLEPRDGERG